LHESALQQLKVGAPPGGPGPDDSLVSDGGGGGSSGGKSYMKTGSLTIFSDIPKGFFLLRNTCRAHPLKASLFI
jgi:hypothetical protein